jgi:cysteine desulfurase/selenocysteine lyase
VPRQSPSSTIDVAAERSITPGCASVAHLNNAGAALPTDTTLAAEIDHLRLEAQIGGYEAAAVAAGQLAAVRAGAAQLIGAHDDEVVLTGSDTQGWSRALWGFALGGGVAEGDRVLIDRIAYDSHYMALLQVAEHWGATIEVVASEDDGTVDLDALSAAVSSGPVAVCTTTHVGTHRGLVNPVEEMGVLCRGAGVPFFVDACQSAGQLPLDVGAIGCDVLTATGRKWLRGPRGTGFLYVRRDLAERMVPPGVGGDGAVWIDADHLEYRPGTTRFLEFEIPVAAHLGLGAAIEHAVALGIDTISERVTELADQLRRLLRATDGVAEHDGKGRQAGIVSFTVDGVEPSAVKGAAAAAGVNVSVTEAPAARLDMGGHRPTTTVRASPHYYNTGEELAALVEVLREVSRGR